jgi:exonuclease III
VALLLSWNVAGRVRRLDEQLELVAAAGADLICLQEVTRSTLGAWSAMLTGGGWQGIALPMLPSGGSGRRVLSVLTAARRPVRTVPVAGVPWPERVLATIVDGLELVNLHSPISPSPGLAKVITHERVHAHLAAGDGPRLLCGDLNTPRREHADGRIWTFARDRSGRLRAERGERWDVAELALIRGLERHGFRDAFRALHGREVREPTWVWQRSGGGYRLDHLIVSEQVRVSKMVYMHEWRDAGLSDHSPRLARVEWPASP